MAGYNRALNSSSEYKQTLIEALVINRPFPPFNETTSVTDMQDPLLALFEKRDFKDSSRIMQLQYDTFGSIDTTLFWETIAFIASQGTFAATSPFSVLIRQANARASRIPTGPQFAEWHRLHETYFKDAIACFDTLVKNGVYQYKQTELEEIFKAALAWSGLHDEGWQVEPSDRTNFISIAKNRKAVLIGPSSVRLGSKRLVGLLLHELYIHAYWAEHYKDTLGRDTSSEEGIGTLVEQLTLDAFSPLRMYRFLAICFAVGVDGIPRDMRQTFELLVEVRRALAPHDRPEIVRTFVAKEVARVWRSLPPDKPGLVYIRDKHYLEHNATIWSTLTAGEPSMERYVALVAPWEKL
jgi:hypothetical protein